MITLNIPQYPFTYSADGKTYNGYYLKTDNPKVILVTIGNNHLEHVEITSKVEYALTMFVQALIISNLLP
jgi:hypothetical protein